MFRIFIHRQAFNEREQKIILVEKFGKISESPFCQITVYVSTFSTKIIICSRSLPEDE